MDNEELACSKAKEYFSLCKNLLQSGKSTILAADVSHLEKMIQIELPFALKKNAPPHFPELYFDFIYEYEKFREFVLYEHLIGKNVVALGGGFSSGKSSFLNSLLGKPLLPAEIDPSTSVPTYIVNDQTEFVYAVNLFDAKVALQTTEIKTIAHGFGEVTDEEGAVVSEEITLGHILKSMFLATPLQTFDHIAFLDTPGYSKSDTASYSAKTDEKIARAQLNSSNYILWFIQADAGTITEEDVQFIQTLRKETPKLFIVNKADKCTPENLEKIKEKIKDVLDIKGISYVDVLSYSRRKPQEYDSAQIREYLAQWNQAVYESTFAYNFKVLFVKCKEYYEEIIDEESRRLNRLQKALTLSDDTTVTECLQSLVNEIKRSIEELKAALGKLKDLQDDFFTDIKHVGDLVGISMPEPSEIDLIQNKIKDPLKVLEEYKKKKGLKASGDLSVVLQDAFLGIKPVLNRTAGHSGYQEEVQELITKNLAIDKEKIKFGK